MRWLNNRSIYTRILLIIVFMSLLNVIITGYGLMKMRLVSHEIKSIADENMPLVQLTSDMTIRQLQTSVIVEKALRQNGQQQNRPIDSLIEQFQTLSHEVDNETATIMRLMSLSIEHALTPALAKKSRQLKVQLENIIQVHKTYEKHALTILHNIQTTSGTLSIGQDVNNLEVIQQQLNRQLGRFLREVEGLTKTAVLKTEQDEREAFVGMSVIAVISLFVGILIGVLIGRQMVQSLRHACEVAKAVAEGDFTVVIDDRQQDEIGELLQTLKHTAQSLSDMVDTIKSSSDTIAATVTELATVASSNREAIHTQQDRTTQVATAMHEMGAAIQEVAQSSAHTADSTKTAEHHIEHSYQQIEMTQNITQTLVERSKRSTQLVEGLQQSSEQIQSFVTEINGIAEQTNLLALNAAIEAARAGDQGRGFAVVADEVRALATRSQEATKQIHGLIERLLNNSSATVDSIQKNSEGIREVSALIDESKGGIEQISNVIHELAEASILVAAANEQQSATSDEIDRNILSIKDTGELIVSSAQETEIASQSLAQLAHVLMDLMHRFKVRGF